MSCTGLSYGAITRIPRTTCSRILFKNHNVDIRSSYIVLPKRNRVNLNAWIDPKCTEQNVGDSLSEIVVKYMCQYYGLEFGKSVKHTRHLYAIGSILLGFQNSTVWGSGFLFDRLLGAKLSWIRFRGLRIIHRFWHTTDVRAVRGPETRRLLQKYGVFCPEVYGDPATLLPLFYKGNPKKQRPYLIIPHHYRMKKYYGRDDVLSPTTNNWKQFIDTLLEAELIISASLHGIILAESYGIPAFLLNDMPGFGLFKYYDWYHSTGRKELPLVNSVEEALLAEHPLSLDLSIIEEMQQRLVKSFPVDLWL